MSSISRFRSFDDRLRTFVANYSVVGTRIALGIIFFWFGVLKFFPQLSPAEDLAGRTIQRLTFGHVTPSVAVPFLAAWETVIGLGLLFASGGYLRATLLLLALQLPGTFLPVLFFPDEVWVHFPYAPTLEGQYIIKNLVIISGALLVGGTMHGGKVISDPAVANEAVRTQQVRQRFRRWFRTDP